KWSISHAAALGRQARSPPKNSRVIAMSGGQPVRDFLLARGLSTRAARPYCSRMDSNQRIAQWEKMTQADPTNSMGWFSLGSAYRDANRLDDSAKALSKAVEL